ncbi:phosphoglycerate kinase [Nanoarchaeota archaeon]
MKTLDSIDVKGKVVLVRVDLNSSVVKGKVFDSPRFKAHSETIKELKKKKAKVIILAHQGRPGNKDFLGLKKHARILNKYVKVKFVGDVIGKKALRAISELKNGDALLLDNVRKLKEEFKPSNRNKLVKVLSKVSDIYVQDAFSVVHRNQTSVVSFPKSLPPYVGRTLERELKSLSKLKASGKKSVYLVGGIKIGEEFSLIEKAIKENKTVLTGGYLGSLCLIAKGYDVGSLSKVLRKKGEYKYLSKIKKYIKSGKLVSPIDIAVSINGKRKELSLSALPTDYPILDIGKKTVGLYKDYLRKANFVVIRGAPGYAELKNFRWGTEQLLRAIASSNSFSIMGGGSLSTIVKELRINTKRFSYISLAGGAFVRYLAGERLPGLEVLK